jgi:AcrR family transcriptional regulator
MTPAEAAAARPRIEGDREQEILDAALEVLAEVGYDRLTMDAVAQRAKASKATLYRRWNSKAKLVVESLARMKTTPEVPDTGDLRTDLITAFCGMGGLTDHDTTSTFGAVVTAVSTDPEFAAEFRRQVVGPKSQVSRRVFERARDRGELRADVDLDLPRRDRPAPRLRPR